MKEFPFSNTDFIFSFYTYIFLNLDYILSLENNGQNENFIFDFDKLGKIYNPCYWDSSVPSICLCTRY